MEKHEEISLRLVHARDAAQRILGSKYTEKVLPYRNLIKEMREKHGKSEMDVGLDLLKSADDLGNDYAKLFICSAILDEIMEEPQP